MKSIVIVFVVTILFLVGMTNFTNDTNYNEALRYAELSEYMNAQTTISYSNEDNQNSEDSLFETIEIDISFEGEVNDENTVKVKAGIYLMDALKEVGGLTNDADLRCINNYYVILESMTFYIPGGKNEDKISINNSKEIELMSLPSIGSTIATRIIEYRKENGEFQCLEDLLNVKGIGSKTFDSFKDYIIL